MLPPELCLVCEESPCSCEEMLPTMLPTGLCLVCVMCPCVCLMTRLESKLYILEIIEEM